MRSKKIFILLPDGVGLRNFAFSHFVRIGEEMGWEVIFWNQTSFDLSTLGFKELKLLGKPKPFTDLLKRTKINAELNYFEKKWDDPVYRSYKFEPSTNGLKAKIKNIIVSFLVSISKNEKDFERLRSKLKESERNSNFYKDCKEVLLKEKPDLIFCTSQRPVNAIAPIVAAQDLNIPTAAFIFSWDNLSKATMVVETDHYLVWSEYMKTELKSYYPHIKEENVHITGTPQFEAHYDRSLLMSKEEFFENYNLNLKKEYLCFSGDDVTTSPDDSQYLEDLAEAVEKLNTEGHDLGIIFRRCPVDFSGRYNSVLNKYPNLIKEIAPLWKDLGDSWNTIMPTEDDVALQANTIHHSVALVNLGSTMVFDAAAHEKPCFYINYDVSKKQIQDWSTDKIYKYVHFRSMPSKNSVVWLNSKKEIAFKISTLFKDDSSEIIKSAESWFKLINVSPPEKASTRIWDVMNSIIN